jgi:ketohexokinase
LAIIKRFIYPGVNVRAEMSACPISVESKSLVTSKIRVIFMHPSPSGILLVGNCILDYVSVVPRFPQEDDEIRALYSYQTMGGNAANSALILQQLGHRVDLMCSLAQDEAADQIRSQLEHAHVNYHLCQTFASGSTPASTVWLSRQNASRTIVHHRGLEELSLRHLQQVDWSIFEWIHFEGRNIETLSKLLPEVHAKGAMISLEIEKPRKGIEELVPYANTIVISSHYLKAKAFGAEEVMRKFRSMNPQANMVCTLGSKGLQGLNCADELITIKAVPVDHPVDTLGAGDCFIAGLVSCLVQQYNFEQAMLFATKLAATKIQVKGLTAGEFPV